MAQEQVNIDLIIKTAESAKNLGDLRRSMSEVRKAIDQVDVGSQAFVRLNAALDDGSEQLRRFRRGFDGLQAFQTFGNTIASSFSLASGVISQFAGDNEELAKQLLKVQGALNIIQGFAGLAEAIKAATIANNALNASLLTNPYVLVAAGIGAAALALLSFSDSAEEAKKANDEFFNSLDETSQLIIENYDKQIQKIEEEKAALDDNASIRQKEIQITQTKIKGLTEALKTLQLTNATSAQGNEFDEKFLESKKKLQTEIGNLEKKLNLQRINDQKETTKELKAQNVELQKQNDLIAEQNKERELDNLQTYIDTYNELIDTQQFELQLLQQTGATDAQVKEQQIQNLIDQETQLAQILAIIRSLNIDEKTRNQLLQQYQGILLKTDRGLVLLQNTTTKANKEIAITGSLIRTELEAAFQAASDLDKLVSQQRNETTKLGTEYLNLVYDFAQINAQELERSQKAVLSQLEDAYKNLGVIVEDALSGETLIFTSQEQVKEFYNLVAAFQRFATEASTQAANFVKTNADLAIKALMTVDKEGKTIIDTKQYSQQYEELLKFVVNEYEKLSNENEKLFQSGKITFDAYLQSQELIYQNTISNLNLASKEFVKNLQDNSSEIAKLLGVSVEEVQKLAEVLGVVLPANIKKGVDALNTTKTSIDQLPESVTKVLGEMQAGLQVFQNFATDLGRTFTLAASNRLTSLEAEQTRVFENLEAQREAGLLSEEQYNTKRVALEQEYNDRIRQEKKKAWRAQKTADVLTATIGVAQAVINGLQVKPFVPLGLASAALAGTLGAIQLGLIASAPEPEFAQGGYVVGPGGSQDDMISAKLSNGEYVMNAKSTKAFFPLIEAMNQAGNANFTGLTVPQFTKPKSEQISKPIPQEQKLKVNLVWQDVEKTNNTSNNIRTRTTF